MMDREVVITQFGHCIKLTSKSGAVPGLFEMALKIVGWNDFWVNARISE